MLNIKILPALYGDCFLLSIKTLEDNINILIDGGLSNVYKNTLKSELKKLAQKDEKIDLIINTHIDSDHIGGIINFLVDNNRDKYIDISDIWYNGFEQICAKYSMLSSNIDNDNDNDNKILENILKKGYEDDFQDTENISVSEGISLASIIKHGNYNQNEVSEGKAITSDLKKIELSDNIKIKIINPTQKKLKELEREWINELSKLEFRFSVPKSIKLLSSFEFLVSRMKNYYEAYKNNVTSDDSLIAYLSDLNDLDNSIVNDSSIAFVLEIYNSKFLFLGDAIIKNEENCEIIKCLIEEYGENVNFEVIKLPHHGSRFNISKDFIRLFKAKEFLISTNSQRFNHPDMDVLANLANENKGVNFIFNYPVNQALKISNEFWKKKFCYDVEIGNGTDIVIRSYKCQ